MLEIAGGIVLAFVFISLLPVILEPLLKLALTATAIVVAGVIGLGLYLLWINATEEGVVFTLAFVVPLSVVAFFHFRSQYKAAKKERIEEERKAREGKEAERQAMIK